MKKPTRTATVRVTYDLPFDVDLHDGEPGDGDIKTDLRALKHDIPRCLPFGDATNLKIELLRGPEVKP